MKKLLMLVVGATLLTAGSLRADEGMWLLPLLQKFNIKDMNKEGCKLTAEQIYSINKSSLKDAVVRFGNGCTAEVISSEGLILTNHHCGYGIIQQQSSVDHDYLRDGFWAMDRSQELISEKGASATFLDSIADVTDQIFPELQKTASETERAAKQKEIIDNMLKKYPQSEFTKYAITPLYGGNVYYLFKYTVYPDIRLVGAPPSSIGKFGADSDNWMWPRHTGDFCLFRIYADKNGKPANPSAENVPLRPKNYFKISLQGVQEGDYAMVMGYPGRTYRFMTSWEVDNMIKANNVRIDVRGVRQSIWMKDMQADQKTRIQYSSKYAGSSNFWKKSIGMNETFEKLGVVERRTEDEKAFTSWVNQKPERVAKYGEALSYIEKSVKERQQRQLALQYMSECLSGTEVVGFAGIATMALSAPANNEDKSAAERRENAKISLLRSYKDYNPTLDQKTAQAMFPIFMKNVPKEYWPDFFKTIETDYKGSVGWYVSEMFSSSIFTNEEKCKAFMQNPGSDLMEKDLAAKTYKSIAEIREKLTKESKPMDELYEKGARLYIAGLLEMNQGKPIYPDANGTMRLTYGTVKSYEPRDGVKYEYYTTLTGVMEKENPNSWEFVVPAKLKELYKAKDFGQYAMKNGQMPLAFIFNGDITGGNSGSPVLNAKGEIIGTAFDGNWEAMSGDIIFETELQRCINVDIRYTLFIIDKFAGASHLVKEMTLVK